MISVRTHADIAPVVILGLFFGLGYGAYQSVDFALAADVLPDPATSAKDLGVWNLSSTLAGICAPLAAGLVLDTFKAVGVAHFGSPRLGYTIMLSGACAMFILSTVLVARIKTGTCLRLCECVRVLERDTHLRVCGALSLC